MDAGEQLDQRRFAGPVFADNGMDFTCLEDQINSLERVGGAKSLTKLLENQKRRAYGHRACFAVTLTLLRLIHRPRGLQGRAGRQFSRGQTHLIFGFKSSCERGLFMFSFVMRFAPVSTFASTFSPFDAARAVLMPS